MPDPKENSSSLTRGTVPPGYREVLYWKISSNARLVVAMQIISLPLFAGSGLLFFWLAVRLGRMPSRVEFGGLNFLWALAAIVLVLVLHELAHGISMRLFGARPRYGVLWKYGMFYATAPGYAFQRNEYLCIALAPLAELSALAILAMPLLSGSSALWLVVLGATANAAGAIGDLWIAAIVLTRYPPHAYVIDERDGMRIFLPESPARAVR